MLNAYKLFSLRWTTFQNCNEIAAKFASILHTRYEITFIKSLQISVLKSQFKVTGRLIGLLMIYGGGDGGGLIF